MNFVKNRNRHSIELQNHYSNFHSRKPWLHFFCSHDRVVVVPRMRDLTLVSFASWLLNENPAAQTEMFGNVLPVQWSGKHISSQYSKKRGCSAQDGG